MQPDPVRGKTASIPGDLLAAYLAARHRADIWQATIREYETEIRTLMGDAAVILQDGQPVLYRRVTSHKNVSWVQDVLVRARNDETPGDR